MASPRQPLLGVLTLLALLTPPAAPAQDLRYRGRDPATGAGWLETASGRLFAVFEGDELPGWGRVLAVEDAELRLEQPLTPEERAALEAQGALPVNARQVILPHQGLLLGPRPWP